MLPLVHVVCRDRSNWNTSALLPEEAHGVPHHTNCSSEPSSHLGIWEFSLEILLSHFPIVPLERQMTHRSGKTLLISVADTATMQMGRYCELHAVPPSTKPQLPYKDNQMHYGIPRPLRGRHNLMCVSHPNTGGPWDERQSVR